jgi:hypothetical protein
VQAASHLTGLRELNLDDCINVTDEGLRTLSSLTALNYLHLAGCYMCERLSSWTFSYTLFAFQQRCALLLTTCTFLPRHPAPSTPPRLPPPRCVDGGSRVAVVPAIHLGPTLVWRRLPSVCGVLHRWCRRHDGTVRCTSAERRQQFGRARGCRGPWHAPVVRLDAVE